MNIIKRIERLFHSTTIHRGKAGRSKVRRGDKRVARSRAVTPRTTTQSDEFLHRVWSGLISEYFPERRELDTYIVAWSTRPQKRVLASCNIRQRKVVVARELFEPTACRWVAPVLYHELCHAVIGEGVHVRGGKRLWHGSEFRSLEARHPDIADMNAWIRSGGWAMAVRSDRTRRAWSKRKAVNE